MPATLRLLILEDQPADAELMVAHLERAGFTPRWQRVETESEFAAALGPQVDLVLADYQLPQYDALRALALVRERELEAPFIIVSGNIGEDLAVGAMQRGAADFVIKDRLARLGPAVARALEERRLREENRRAQEALRQLEELSRRILAAAHELAKVTPHYEHLSAMARELAVTPAQAAAVDAADAPVREYLEAKLSELLHTFSLFASANEVARNAAPETARAPALLAAVQDTIQVLEQTKRAFKSKALGQLRARLEAVLQSPGPGGGAVPPAVRAEHP